MLAERIKRLKAAVAAAGRTPAEVAAVLRAAGLRGRRGDPGHVSSRDPLSLFLSGRCGEPVTCGACLAAYPDSLVGCVALAPGQRRFLDQFRRGRWREFDESFAGRQPRAASR